MDSTPPQILVIEDEAPIRVGLCDVLAYHGLHPVPAPDGDVGLREALTGRFALLLVDVMLPGVDGFTICRRVREALPSQAMILLTAKGAEADVLEGFASGADDYVCKPFSVAQLMARVQALLRRAGVHGHRRFSVGAATVDADALRLEVDGRTVEVTPRDVEILAYLAERKDRVVARDELLHDIWGFRRTDRVETRCVDMHLSKLRRKIAQVTAEELIETVRGAGYRVGA
ncbi:MAG: response regulator transcription factor [Myxococcota bacterium]